MRHFVLTGGIPCIMFGAGEVRDAHAPNESISLEDLFSAIEATALFVAEWCASRN
jgi:acetylornithine deacetylase